MLVSSFLSFIKSDTFKKTFETICSGVSIQVFLFISGPLVARMLGVEGRGYFAAINVWVVAVFTLGTLGIPMATTYYINRSYYNTEMICGEAYRIAIIQIVVLVPLLGLIFLMWGRGKPLSVRESFLPALMMVPSGVLIQYGLGILQGKQLFRAFNFSRLIPVFFYFIGVLILFLMGETSLNKVVITWTAAWCLASIIITITAKYNIKIAWEKSQELKRGLYDFGIKGFLGSVAPMETLKIDLLFGAFLLSPVDLGLYSIAYSFTNFPRFISKSAGMVAYPRIASLDKGYEAVNLLWRFFFSITLLNIILFSFFFIAMPIMIPMLFGDVFLPSVPIAKVLILGSTITSSQRILADCMRGLGHPQISTISEVSNYPIFLIIGVLGMVKLGSIGLAMAICACSICSFLVCLIISLKKLRCLS